MDEQSDYVQPWVKDLRWGLRILILLSGIYQTLFGEKEIGIIILLLLAIITLPSYFTKNRIKKLPIEIEIIFSIMVFIQYILGEARDFYNYIPYYDKIMHYMLPMFIGLMGFIIFYAMSMSGRLKASNSVMVFLIVLIVLGISAFWEILEYLSDILLLPHIEGFRHFQGNSQQNALDDTMTDLIYNLLGGIFGALLGLRFVSAGIKNGNKRLTQLVKEIALLWQTDPTEISAKKD